MPDREKVIAQLTADMDIATLTGESLVHIMRETVETALALLREQEPTRLIMEPDRRNHYHCEKCGYVTGLIGRTYKFCPECGKRVKRDEADRC